MELKSKVFNCVNPCIGPNPLPVPFLPFMHVPQPPGYLDEEEIHQDKGLIHHDLGLQFQSELQAWLEEDIFWLK